ncbi:MAG: hypothetical protein LBC31_06105 [Treponema sp.]|jgi:hypothetical protein|nr:hypothetical protein [Treponema sp.]
MKRSSKSSGAKWPGVLFTLVCFAGAAFGLWLFWMDINSVLLKRAEEPVGTLSYKRHVVQRRFEDRLMWNQIPRESPVYNGDLVRTSDLSDAVILFISEDSVRLSENSLIQVHYDKDANSFIELLSGDVSLESVSGRVGILAEGRQLLPAAGSALLVRRGSSGTEAKALSGHTEISGPGGIRGLEPGQSARAGGDGPVAITEALLVSSPLADQELAADADPMPVAFSWIGLAPAEYVRLEIAARRDFGDLVYAGDEYQAGATVSLSPGVWWWRVFQAERGKPLPSGPAQTGRLTVLEPPANPGTAVITPFFFSAAAEGSLPVLHSLPASAGTAAEEPLPAPPPAAAAPPVPVAPSAPPLLPAPRGLFPPRGTVIDPVYLRTGGTGARIAFSWDPVGGANAYIITIRRGLTVNLHMVREPRFVFTNLASLDNGQWTWQVEALALDSSGGTRRHGQLAESAFSLDVPKPDAPKVDNPGIIYER